jgi:hypothetical protein
MNPRIVASSLTMLACLALAGCFGGSGSKGGSYPGGGSVPSGGGGPTGGGPTGGPGPVTPPGGSGSGSGGWSEPACFNDDDCWDAVLIQDDCEVPICDSATGTCTVGIRPDTSACEDGDLCTGDDACFGGVCMSTGVLMLDCDDGDPCTFDYCVPAQGCAYEPNPDCMGPPTGGCCDGHGGLGCLDPGIEACVCSIDPYCCEVEWDDQCAAQVEEYGCASCGGGPPPPPAPATCAGYCGGQAPSGCWCDDECAAYGDCCEDICYECGDVLASCGPQDCFTATGLPGCDDWQCEDCTCSLDDYCCTTAWDETCVDMATAECGQACGLDGPPLACSIPHDTPGCGNGPCESCVCSADDYCCTTAWDETCVEEIETFGCWECY